MFTTLGTAEEYAGEGYTSTFGNTLLSVSLTIEGTSASPVRLSPTKFIRRTPSGVSLFFMSSNDSTLTRWLGGVSPEKASTNMTSYASPGDLRKNLPSWINVLCLLLVPWERQKVRVRPN